MLAEAVWTSLAQGLRAGKLLPCSVAIRRWQILFTGNFRPVVSATNTRKRRPCRHERGSRLLRGGGRPTFAFAQTLALVLTFRKIPRVTRPNTHHVTDRFAYAITVQLTGASDRAARRIGHDGAKTSAARYDPMSRRRRTLDVLRGVGRDAARLPKCGRHGHGSSCITPEHGAGNPESSVFIGERRRQRPIRRDRGGVLRPGTETLLSLTGREQNGT